MDSAIGGFLVADIRGVNSKAVFGIFARVGVTRAGESPREFRQFILKTVQHYHLAKPLAALKREIEQSGAKWPEEAFAAPKAAGFRASIATAALRSGI